MIRTDAEYEVAVKRLSKDREVIELQRAKLREMGLSRMEVERAMQPPLSFHEQLREETEMYERMRRGDFGPVHDLNSIGRVLIGLRIATGMNQKELAERLNVAESVVSRDERNEYHGISVERAQRIVDALKGRLTVEIEAPPRAAAVVG